MSPRGWGAPLRLSRRTALAVAVVSLVAIGCGIGTDNATLPSTTLPSTTLPSTTLPSTTLLSTTLPSTATASTTTPPTVTTASGVTSTSTTTEPPPVGPPNGGGPVWTRDFPDPFVLAGTGANHAFATSSGFVQVQRLEAPSLEGWTGPAEAMPGRAPWAVVLSVWAPAVVEAGDSWVLYYTARVDGTDKHCISVAEGATPRGPFVDSTTEPWLCPADLGGAIDPSPFVDADGTRYLLWKNDGVTLRQESSIWIQPLTDDGRSFAGDPVRLIETDQAWEFPHVEAPSMLLVDRTYWLAYSGNWWNQAAYGIGFARCATATGPCDKPFDGPLVSSRPGAEGPGGAELFVDPAGRAHLAYHAWLGEPGYPGHRALWIDEVDFGGERPAVGGRPTGPIG